MIYLRNQFFSYSNSLKVKCNVKKTLSLIFITTKANRELRKISYLYLRSFYWSWVVIALRRKQNNFWLTLTPAAVSVIRPHYGFEEGWNLPTCRLSSNNLLFIPKTSPFSSGIFSGNKLLIGNKLPLRCRKTAF